MVGSCLAPLIMASHCFLKITGPRRSDSYAFDLIERDRVASAIVEFCRARAFVRRHGLGVLQRTASFQVGRDAGGPKCMIADPDLHAKPGRPPCG